MFQEFLGADDAAVGAEQHFQHAELLAGQHDGPPRPADPPPDPVHDQVPAVHDRRRGRAAPGQGPDPRDQFGERERLAQVVVGAQVEAVHPVFYIGGRGQHEDAGCRRPGNQVSGHRVAVHPRQPAVEHDDVVAGERGYLHRGRAVVGHVHGHALVAQAFRYAVGEHLLILHNQHSHDPMVPQPG